MCEATISDVNEHGTAMDCCDMPRMMCCPSVIPPLGQLMLLFVTVHQSGIIQEVLLSRLKPQSLIKASSQTSAREATVSQPKTRVRAGIRIHATACMTILRGQFRDVIMQS